MPHGDDLPDTGRSSIGRSGCGFGVAATEGGIQRVEPVSSSVVVTIEPSVDYVDEVAERATESPQGRREFSPVGRHFVEVTAEGYNRWIRNVEVGRDVDLVVDVELRRSLPEEIR